MDCDGTDAVRSTGEFQITNSPLISPLEVIVFYGFLCDIKGACCAGWASLTHTITPFAYFPPNSQPPPPISVNYSSAGLCAYSFKNQMSVRTVSQMVRYIGHLGELTLQSLSEPVYVGTVVRCLGSG